MIDDLICDGRFDARLVRENKSAKGIFITLEIAADDYFAAKLSDVRPGALLKIGYQEIVDVSVQPIELEVRTTPPTSVKASAQLLKEMHPDKPKERFEDLPLVKQCVLRCGDEEFMNFFDAVHDRRLEESLADAVRRYCAVASRAEIKPGTNAAKRWLGLEHQYQNWLTDQKYGQARR